jgi:predicted dehydrogenase
MNPVRLLIVGAGNRGWTYSHFALAEPDHATVTAVAEPRNFQRERLASAHQIPPEHCFADWRDVATLPHRIADAALICTQDHDHVEPAMALAQLGYDLLIEKPLAPTEADCEKATNALGATGQIIAVCHVLRYTRYTNALKKLLTEGRLGHIITIQHFEPVGWWHQAHSFVRGNWRRQDESSFMLLTKSCHDIDWLLHLMPQPVTRVSSAGGLSHFKASEKPPGATDRCLDCPVETSCPYSAKRFYLDQLETPGRLGWAGVLTNDTTSEGILEALRTGPYGRCVYACDNDVVDHQTVDLVFQDGATASFTMTAFTPAMHRKTRICGSHGYIEGDGRYLELTDFVTGTCEKIDTEADVPLWPENSPMAKLHGHGGGDYGVMTAFISAVTSQNAEHLSSGLAATSDSHRLVFAAEKARIQGRWIDLTK